MGVIWYIVGIALTFGAFFMEDDRKFFALTVGAVYLVGANLYFKLLDIEKKIK